jgi:hypothetical protein
MNEPVKLMLLDGSNRFCWGKTLNVSATGVSLTASGPVPVGTPVKLEVTDGMILGEVRFCELRQDPPAGYSLGISLEHVLFGWMEFYERARALEIVVDEPEVQTAVPQAVER